MGIWAGDVAEASRVRRKCPYPWTEVAFSSGEDGKEVEAQALVLALHRLAMGPTHTRVWAPAAQVRGWEDMPISPAQFSSCSSLCPRPKALA